MEIEDDDMDVDLGNMELPCSQEVRFYIIQFFFISMKIDFFF